MTEVAVLLGVGDDAKAVVVVVVVAAFSVGCAPPRRSIAQRPARFLRLPENKRRAAGVTKAVVVVVHSVRSSSSSRKREAAPCRDLPQVDILMGRARKGLVPSTCLVVCMQAS